jgi:hypothetical protein
LDWDLWLGPAAERPYEPFYAPWNWRGWSAFGCGCLGDWFCHVADPSYWAKMQFTNCPEANKPVTPNFRAGWKL